MNNIELIHQDFDTAVETLVKIADLKEKKAATINAPAPQNDYDEGKWLASMGFENTVKAVKAKQFDLGHTKAINEKTANSDEAKNIHEIVRRYSAMYPFHKFILYSQVINICEKYNLVLAPVQLYKGDIPSKNVKELRNFDMTTYKKNDQYIPGFENNIPICSQSIRRNRGGWNNSTHTPPMYICAPENEFKKNSKVFTVGRELYINGKTPSINPLKHKANIQLRPKPKDPIILIPVLAEELHQIGFIVITKWGIEANDPELQVGINN